MKKIQEMKTKNQRAEEIFFFEINLLFEFHLCLQLFSKNSHLVVLTSILLSIDSCIVSVPSVWHSVMRCWKDVNPFSFTQLTLTPSSIRTKKSTFGALNYSNYLISICYKKIKKGEKSVIEKHHKSKIY
jgi:hypothetical protein